MFLMLAVVGLLLHFLLLEVVSFSNFSGEFIDSRCHTSLDK